MNEMTEPEPAGAKVGTKVVPSEGWLRKHRERMRTAKPVAKPEPKTRERNEEKPKTEKKEESQSLGQDGRDGKSLGIGDGKMQGLGDGWGW